MTLDWILGVGTVIFAITTWATLSFGYAYFRELGRRDDVAAAGLARNRPAAEDAVADDASDTVRDAVPEHAAPGV
jgi:hypothetical protein